MMILKKISSLILFFNILLGLDVLNFPQNSYNLSNWNGGGASSNIYNQSNPASLPFKDFISFSMINVPTDITSQNIFITKSYADYLFKFNSTILNYGDLEDFVTKNKFTAKDIQFGLSIKTTVQKIISIGIQLNYLNRNIENSTDKLLNSKIGIRTQLLEKRLGLGFVLNQIYKSNFDNNDGNLLFNFFYKPLYFPGEIALDFSKSEKLNVILSMMVNVNNNIDLTIGMTDNKMDLHTGNTYENIISGLSFGLHFKLKNYNFGFGLRNIGQFGTISGLNLGYNF